MRFSPTLLTRSIHVDTNSRICFFLWMDNIPLCVCVYRYHIFFINSSINGHLGAVCLVTQSCPILCDHMDYSPPGSSVHGDSLGKNTGAGCQALLQRNHPNLGIEPTSPALQVYSLSSEPYGHLGIW